MKGSSLLKTLHVREVKSDEILSMWIAIDKINDASSDELIGKVVNNKYKIDKYLGQGGFGKVYTVLDQSENKM